MIGRLAAAVLTELICTIMLLYGGGYLPSDHTRALHPFLARPRHNADTAGVEYLDARRSRFVDVGNV